jgi:hypothetical protein
MDLAIKLSRKARVGMVRTVEQGGAKEIISHALSLEVYPETLDPRPLRWPCPFELTAEVVLPKPAVTVLNLSYTLFLKEKNFKLWNH